MKSLYRYLAQPVNCGYLSGQSARLEYEYVISLSTDEYRDRLLSGWRRFGASLFRPRCSRCSACQSMRVDVARFQANRSQQRAWRANETTTRLQIEQPALTPSKLLLYDRYHQHQRFSKGWPEHADGDAEAYLASFVDNPIPTEEWCYFDGHDLIGVGYVDALPIGLSAIYFYHDPDFRSRSVGTFNILCLIAEAARRRLPHVYLGYYVSACGSLAYKNRFRPSEILGADGSWRPFEPEN